LHTLVYIRSHLNFSSEIPKINTYVLKRKITFA
jgi:hypothetical protein